MNHTLRPYSAYKDSGIPWLGEVPKHWGILPNRALFIEAKERGFASEQLLSVTIANGVIRQSQLLSNTTKKDSSNEDKSKYKLVCPEDIAYNKMRVWQGALGVSKIRGIVSPAYIVMRPREVQNSRYFHYLLRTPYFIKEAERWSYGISSDQWSLRPEEFKQIYCSVPPLPEQSAIVRYLDYVNRRIRRYILIKRKLIALLNEQKQAIIQQAVTRGLDPNVRLKPSGVEWLGEVPEHWDLQSLGSLINARSERLGTDLPLLSVVREKGIILRSEMSEKENRNYVPEDLSNYKVVRKGDLVINKMKAWQGSLGISSFDGVVSPAYYVYKLKFNNLMFGHVLLRSKTYVGFFGQSSDGVRVGQWDLSIPGMKRIPIVIPPPSEQSLIVNYIDDAIYYIDKGVKAARQEISLIQEYRTRLIADVVTGKLDVREAAARLPEESEEIEALEELEALAEKDEAIDEENLEGTNGEDEA